MFLFRYPNLENRNITKILGEWWSNLNPEEKDPFNTLAVTYKEYLMREQPNIRWRTKQQQQQQQQQQQNVNQRSASFDATTSKSGGGGGGGAVTIAPVIENSQNNKTTTNRTVDPGESRGSSGSSSPEPPGSANGNGNNGSVSATSAPKPFKKRWLAAEKAKQDSSSSSLSTNSETKNACEALLELAKGQAGHSESASAPASGSCSPKSGANKNKNPYEKVKESVQFSELRDAVWSKMAKTLLTQDGDKSKDDLHAVTNGEAPINLSSKINCRIHGQTIIEHIIENILNDNPDEKDTSTDSSSILNNNASSNSDANSESSHEQIKEKIYESLKEEFRERTLVKDDSTDVSDLWRMLPNPSAKMPLNGTDPVAAMKSEQRLATSKSAPESKLPSPKQKDQQQQQPSVSVTLIQEESNAEDSPLNLSTTPPQTPAGSSGSTTGPGSTSGDSKSGGGVAVTITRTSPTKRRLLDDDDDEIRRSSRSCKGRRYQEFKDAAVGKKGRKGAEASTSEDEQQPQDAVFQPSPPKQFKPNQPAGSVIKSVRSLSTSADLQTISPRPPFDLEKALTAIPALRPEEFQRRIQINRQIQKAPSGPAVAPSSEAPVVVAAAGDVTISANPPQRKTKDSNS